MTRANRCTQLILSTFVAAIGLAGLDMPDHPGSALEPAAWGMSITHAAEDDASSSSENEDSGASESTSNETRQEGDDDSMSAESIAQKVQSIYSDTDDFQAEFKQTYRDVAAGDTKVRWGKVYFKKPGKMRWDYYEDESLESRTKTLVSDGDIFWIYELEFDQVFKKCLGDSQLSTSLKFLMGQGELLEDFEVSMTDDSTFETPELALVPKEPTSKYKKVHFQVDPETYRVDETTVFDPYGNTNTIDFRTIEIDNNLPDSGFEFEVPEDARLLNREKDCS